MKLHDLVLPEKLEFDKDKLSETYGRFVAEPYERGYGHTIGNSLRRILLSSLEGASVTAVHIPGVPHEYSVIPGVREDVMGIILNLKQLRFKVYTSGSQILKLNVSRKSEVTSGDFQENSNVEIVNKDLMIAHLNPGGKLQMEIEVSMGRGFVPAERNKRSDRPDGFIATDALFSPVRKVYYEVENARVGQITDYDRLVMEVWTDGSVAPLDAMAYSAKILRDSLTAFVPLEEEKLPPPMVLPLTQKERESSTDVLSKSASEMNLSVRAANCLKNAKLSSIGELVQKTEEELLHYKNFGKVSLIEIKEKLKEMGLSLRVDQS